jgi:hypothetical protein
MSDTNTWPDPERPGVPLNPEQDGWHWLGDASGVAVPIAWTPASSGAYVAGGWEVHPGTLAKTARYLGPVLSPAEVAAAIVLARRYALEEAARMATAFADAYQDKEMAKRGQNLVFDFATITQCGRETSRNIAAAIRALAGEPGNE